MLGRAGQALPDLLWRAALLLLPLTSLPLLSQLLFGSMVAPPALLFFGLLALVWLLPAWRRGAPVASESRPLLAFAFVLLLSWLVAFWRAAPGWRSASPLSEGLQAWLTVAGGLCVYWVVAGYLADDPRRLPAALRWLNLGGLALLLWSGLQAYFVLTQDSQYPDWLYQAQGWFSATPMRLFPRRVTGLAYEPSWLGHQLVMLYLPYWLAATASGWSAYRAWGRWRVEHALLAGGLLVLFVSFSRVAWISFTLMAGWLLLQFNLWLGAWLHRRLITASGGAAAVRAWQTHLPWLNRLAPGRLLSLMLLLAFLLVYGGLMTGLVLAAARLDPRFALLFQENLFDGGSFFDLTNRLLFGERVIYWATGWKIFESAPWLGVGLGNAGFYFNDWMPDYGWNLVEIRMLLLGSDVTPNIKNFWLRLLAEGGLLSFSFFVAWLLQLALSSGLARRYGDAQARMVGLWGQLVLIGLLSEGFSVDSFALPYLWFSLAALTAAALTTRTGLPHPQPLPASQGGENSPPGRALHLIICLLFASGLAGCAAATPLPTNVSPTPSPVAPTYTPTATLPLAAARRATPVASAVLLPQLNLQPTLTPAATPADCCRELPLTFLLRRPGPLVADALLAQLSQGLETAAALPISDLNDLARRFRWAEPGAQTGGGLHAPPPPAPSAYQPGDRRLFWVSDLNQDSSFQVEARLEAVGEHSYFWVESGLTFDAAELQSLAEFFDRQIYPTNRALFGSEPLPGVDGDPRLYILYARNLGAQIAGYFSALDAYAPDSLAHPYANGHEMFLVNADTVSLGSLFARQVLAHEFQHTIHWQQDRDESAWLNEGLAELAALVNGVYASGSDRAYAVNPDTQLTDWPLDGPLLPQYGAGFLFSAYFYDRFGAEAVRALAADPANSLTSLDALLADLQPGAPPVGWPLPADVFLLDWLAANYLNGAPLADGRLAYRSYTDFPAFSSRSLLSEGCTVAPVQTDVRQYGVDYYRLRCNQPARLRFQGQAETRLLPAAPHSGEAALWSGRGDQADLKLTQRFDWRGHSGPLTLRYWAWYDLEANYDYLYLAASLDGERWQVLTTPSGSDADSSGNSYGWAYNGRSPGWVEEQVDLSAFAGQQVWLRFEYITDAAVNGEGFLLDDLQIPQTGYACDFERDNCGWQAEGWLHLENSWRLPQTFGLRLLRPASETAPALASEPLFLGPGEDIEILLPFEPAQTDLVLIVSGLTRFTRQPAHYTFSIQPLQP